MCAVASRRHFNVLLLLLLRERGLIQFNLDAVNTRGQTAAQMSKDPETTDVLMLVQALDGADMRGEQRAALLSDGRASGFTKHLMIRILVGAENQAEAVAALLKAAKKTARWNDAQARHVDQLDDTARDRRATRGVSCAIHAQISDMK